MSEEQKQTASEKQQIDRQKLFFRSETVQMQRSEMHLSDYNPRKIDEEGRKQLKNSIMRYGVVGGIVVNKQTGNTIVAGHQKVAILDKYHHFPDKDYTLKVELVDVDEKTEKEMNITLNNPNVGGMWDFDQLRVLIPDIDYKAAGLTENDLSVIGVDYLLQTEGEAGIADEFADLTKERDAAHAAEMQARKEARQQAGIEDEEDDDELDFFDEEPDADAAEAERQAKIAHAKEVKAQVKENAIKEAKDMSAYVMLSFSDFDTKCEFMEKYGFDPYSRMIKGEDFDMRAEPAIYDEDDEQNQEEDN